jgi:transcriptional regulator with XRE-family HTH domain
MSLTASVYKGMNGDSFGGRLRKLVDDRCSGYEQCASDLGISLSYLHILMNEPLTVSNPSVRLLKRMALRLGERVGYLVGESLETDPIFLDSNVAWHDWVKTPGLDAGVAVAVREEWRHEYATDRRERLSNVSHRKPTKRMEVTDWDRRYQQHLKARGSANAGSLFA